MITEAVTLELPVSRLELELMKAAIEEKVAHLDAELTKLRAKFPFVDLEDNAEVTRLMVSVYAGILRQIDLKLDVPFA